MDLSKSQLFFLIDSIDAESENGSYKAVRLAEEVYNALYDDELDIEGYERVKWIKFDPNDPKTFPSKTDEYIVAIEGLSTSTTRKYSAEYLEFFAPEKITHWRPLPKPPGKEELQ